jgi:TIR domain
MKKRIFISHIHEEHALGAVIADWVTDAFAGNPVQAFLSSDDKSIVAGQKWLDVVEHELAGTAVMISLLSPASLARPWVNIELGAAWIKRVPIIPLCHAGLSASTLPRPFSDFQSIGLAQDNAAKRLIDGVALHLDFPYSKKLHFEDFLTHMRAAAKTSELLQVVSKAIDSAPINNLPDEQGAILVVLAEEGNRGGDGYVDNENAPGMCGLKPMLFKHHVEKLYDAGLVDIEIWGDARHYKITGNGVGWLLERDLMPE